MPKTESNSKTEKDKPQTPQFFPDAPPFEDDTIDLYELWITLWSKKWFVLGVTAVVALGSVVFALNQPPVYKAKALILPPKAQDIQSLNLKAVLGEYIELDVLSAFSSFKNNLSSRNLQKKFIKEYGLMEVLAPERTAATRDVDIYENFSKLFKIEDNSISIELNDPEVAAQWVNDYIKFIDTETISLLLENIRNAITNSTKAIEYSIGSKRQMAKQRREDTILLYKEATNIAIKLGVKERVDTTNVVQNNELNNSTGSTPLYYRGFRALNAEIAVLNTRKSDDPYIIGLRDLQENLALLRSIKIPNEGIHAMEIDRAAYPPINRIKPNRRLIVSLGTVVGLFLGILLVFFVSFVQKQKKAQSE